jgi:hypothetical protein
MIETPWARSATPVTLPMARTISRILSRGQRSRSPRATVRRIRKVAGLASCRKSSPSISNSIRIGAGLYRHSDRQLISLSLFQNCVHKLAKKHFLCKAKPMTSMVVSCDESLRALDLIDQIFFESRSRAFDSGLRILAILVFSARGASERKFAPAGASA